MNLQNLIYLSMYFIIYSFMGWILESVTKTIAQKKFVNSGFLYGPFCPIYGIGAVAMIFILDSFKGHYILTFIVSFFVFSIWEYFVGWLLEKIFHTKYWDYSYYRFQIKGRVCLVNSLTWGFLGVAFIELVHPITQALITNLPVKLIDITTIIILMYMLVDLVLTCIKINNINIKLDKLIDITNSIKEKVEELKQKAENSERLNNIVEELKQKQEELKLKIEKQTKRFRKAFPNMTSEKINQFLKQKIEIRKQDKK